MTITDALSRIAQIQSTLVQLENPVDGRLDEHDLVRLVRLVHHSATDFADALAGALGTTDAGSTLGGGSRDRGGRGRRREEVPGRAVRVRRRTTSSGLDCSGLVQRVFDDLGIDVPRLVSGQAKLGTEVPSLAQAQPGDLIVTGGGEHILIYAGDHKVIHAPRPGKDVRLVEAYMDDSQIDTIRRVVPQASTATATVSGASGASGTGLVQRPGRCLAVAVPVDAVGSLAVSPVVSAPAQAPAAHAPSNAATRKAGSADAFGQFLKGATESAEPAGGAAGEKRKPAVKDAHREPHSHTQSHEAVGPAGGTGASDPAARTAAEATGTAADTHADCGQRDSRRDGRRADIRRRTGGCGCGRRCDDRDGTRCCRRCAAAPNGPAANVLTATSAAAAQGSLSPATATEAAAATLPSQATRHARNAHDSGDTVDLFRGARADGAFECCDGIRCCRIRGPIRRCRRGARDAERGEGWTRNAVRRAGHRRLGNSRYADAHGVSRSLCGDRVEADRVPGRVRRTGSAAEPPPQRRHPRRPHRRPQRSWRRRPPIPHRPPRAPSNKQPLLRLRPRSRPRRRPRRPCRPSCPHPEPHATAPAAPAAPANAAAGLPAQLSRPLFTLASAGQGQHVMTVHVTPEALGPVTVRAHVGAEGVRVELFAPTDVGRDALRSILPDLRRDLSGAGLSGSLDLSSQNQPSPNGDERAPWLSNGRQNASGDRPRERAARIRRPRPDAAAGTPPRRARPHHRPRRLGDRKEPPWPSIP